MKEYLKTSQARTNDGSDSDGDDEMEESAPKPKAVSFSDLAAITGWEVIAYYCEDPIIVIHRFRFTPLRFIL